MAESFFFFFYQGSVGVKSDHFLPLEQPLVTKKHNHKINNGS